LIGPGLDLREPGVNACPGVFIGVAALHFSLDSPDRTAALALPASARESRSRNRPTSVTTPTACHVPRSLTFVATAGLMSTQTILTQLGSMLPTAMECSMEPRHSTKPATRSWTE